MVQYQSTNCFQGSVKRFCSAIRAACFQLVTVEDFAVTAEVASTTLGSLGPWRSKGNLRVRLLCLIVHCIANRGLREPHESIRPGRVCSIIVYSVRIGPPQPRFSFLSAGSANPATIRIVVRIRNEPDGLQPGAVGLCYQVDIHSFHQMMTGRHFM
jgi:hypothetical protein